MTTPGTDTGARRFGPIQMLVVGFDEPKFTGKILPEFTRLRELEVVRLLDMLVVQKDDEGEITVYQQSDLEQDEATEFGAFIGALIEHRWAIPLRDKIVAAGGFALADEWIHPADLIAIGMVAAEGVEA